nr:retrovirus-related Pol polyprotein from transposon TNT 1-94 [Tanacetum cinerariifolium]
MFKLSVSQCDSPNSVSKTSCASNKVETKTKRKRRNRNSSKQTGKQVNNDLRANRDFVHFSDLDTLSSVRRPNPSGVIWKKKGSSNIVKADLSFVNHSNLNKNVKRYTRKDLLSCNNSHLVDTKNVVIGSMTIKRVYYVEGPGHNLFSIGQFCDKGLEVTFRKSACFVRNENGVDLLTGDRSSNLYTIALNEIASNSSSCLLAKASSLESWLWHQRLFHLNFAKINNLVKNNLVRGLHKMKFKKYHLCFACEQGKIHQKHHKSKTAFASNQPLSLLHMDLCGLMRIESINRKRYVLIVVDDFSRCYLLNDYDDVGKLKAKGDIGVFVGYSKESAALRIYNKCTRKPHEKKWTKEHPLYKIIGDPNLSVRIRDQLANSCLFTCLLSSIEPASVAKALKDANWVIAMQHELDQFARLKVWRLVPKPEGKAVIKTKWIFKNKKDERIARIKAMHLFLAYAAHKDVTVFQMDVKTTFLNGILKEEVYVAQPLCFFSKQYPHHMYALNKALYGLKQAPQAWYMLASLDGTEPGYRKTWTR